MKKVFGSLLLLTVLFVSACSDVEVPEQSPFEKDLALVATKAAATLHHDVGKVEIDVIPVVPVLPPPVPPVPPTDEDLFNLKLYHFIATVPPVMLEHNAIDEYRAQNGGIDVEDFYDEEGVFLMEDFDFATTSATFQYLFEQIITDNLCALTVAEIANNGDLNKFEKITLAYFMGIDAIDEIDAALIDTKGATNIQICEMKFRRDKQRCAIARDALKARALFNSLGVICLSPDESVLYQGPRATWTMAKGVGVYGVVQDYYTMCLASAVDNFRKCLQI